MIATAERPGTAATELPASISERAARLTRVELERLFLGVVSGLLSDRDRRQVERLLQQRDGEGQGRES